MLATYGEGDPTDNAVEFHEKLTSDGMDLRCKYKYKFKYRCQYHSGMAFAVFGLGNKTYEHFNAMGKMWDYSYPSFYSYLFSFCSYSC